MKVLEIEVKYSKTIQEKQFEPVNFEARMKIKLDEDDEREELWSEGFSDVVAEVNEAIKIHLKKPEKYKRGGR